MFVTCNSFFCLSPICYIDKLVSNWVSNWVKTCYICAKLGKEKVSECALHILLKQLHDFLD